MNNDEQVRLLVPRATAQRLQRDLTRRRFLQLGGSALAAVGLGLTACGTGGGTSTTAGGSALPVIGGDLSIYTWAEYQNPENTEAFAAATDVNVVVDIYDSNEAMIAKLELAEGTSGYDILVPTSGFIPLMTSKNLLLKLDYSKIPNSVNTDPAIAALAASHDPGNEYAIIKDWGSTGWVYDTSVVTDEIATWADFMTVAAKPGVSGKVSILGAPGDVTGIVFWRDGIDWNTTDPADLDHAEQVLIDELAPHLKAFDSYPAVTMIAGEYALSQAWNGDARVAVIEDPEKYKWGLGAPKTELWVDTWAISATAEHLEAAYAWLNNILDPAVSAKEIDFHGYNTAVLGTEDFLPDDLAAPEIIYFTDEETGRLVPGYVTEAQDRIVEIYNKLKAAAGI